MPGKSSGGPLSRSSWHEEQHRREAATTQTASLEWQGCAQVGIGGMQPLIAIEPAHTTYAPEECPTLIPLSQEVGRDRRTTPVRRGRRLGLP